MRFLSSLAASVVGTLLALGIVVFFVFFFLFAVALSTDRAPQVEAGSVLTLPLEGPLPERVTDDPFRQAFGEGAAYDLRDLQTALRKARADGRIEAVWLRMKGLSAGWATLEEVRQAVVEARENGLPVIASSDEFGMSEKDYFVASAADSVFTSPQSSFEYNGFTTTIAFFNNALERLNVEPQIIRAGRYKSAGEPFVRSNLSESNREQLTALLETVNDRFLTTIAEARDEPVGGLDRLAVEEAFLDPSTALEEGLIDGLRYEDEVRDRLAELVDRPLSNELSTISPKEYSRVSVSDAGLSYTGTGQIDIVYAEGNIVSGEPSENPMGPAPDVIGSTTLTNALEEARTNSSTEAVVLRVNSPGGSAAASEAMWRAVDRTAAEKPVIVSMGDVAASGGYYIAAAGDTIVADPTTTTGSIGVFGLVVNAKGFFEDKLGVTFDGVSTSPYADLFSATKPLDASERELIGRSIDSTYQTFLRRVADGRGMDVSAVDEVAQGRVWSGRDAVERGLVDTTGSLTDAVALAGRQAGLGEGPYRTRILPQPKTFVEQLAEQFAAQASTVWRTLRTNALERKLWRQKQVLERLIGTHGTIQARLPFEVTVK